MKLIILNGPPGVGKSTIAKRLHAEMPMSLLIEGDEWRRQISQWQEHREASHDLVYAIKVAATDVALKMGSNVIVEKAIFGNDAAIDALIASARAHNADAYEFILNADKETILARADARGYRPGSTFTPERAPILWQKAQDLIARRPHAIVIDTSHLDPDAAYEKVKKIVLDS